MKLSKLIFISNLWLMKTNQKGQKTYHKHEDNFPPSLLLHKLMKYMVTTIISQINVAKTLSIFNSHLLIVFWFIFLLPFFLPTWKVYICQRFWLEKADDSGMLKKICLKKQLPYMWMSDVRKKWYTTVV